jgi:hypothetical protein
MFKTRPFETRGSHDTDCECDLNGMSCHVVLKNVAIVFKDLLTWRWKQHQNAGKFISDGMTPYSKRLYFFNCLVGMQK